MLDAPARAFLRFGESLSQTPEILCLVERSSQRGVADKLLRMRNSQKLFECAAGTPAIAAMRKLDQHIPRMRIGERVARIRHVTQRKVLSLMRPQLERRQR